MKFNSIKSISKILLYSLFTSVFILFTFTTYAQCDSVSLNLYDSYGDGWNGGIMTVDSVD